jgi:NAD(P)H dehydrogenase (quinone)
MGKVLVLYYSRGGNTRTMADLVATGARDVKGTDVRCLPVERASHRDVLWCDGIALGAPTYLGTAPSKMKEWWETNTGALWGKVDGKFGCAFSSQGGWGGGAELTCMSLLIILMNFGIMVFGLPDYTGRKFTLHYGSVVAGKPREKKEMESCRRLGERLAQWVARYCDGKKRVHPRSGKAGT